MSDCRARRLRRHRLRHRRGDEHRDATARAGRCASAARRRAGSRRGCPSATATSRSTAPRSPTMPEPVVRQVRRFTRDIDQQPRRGPRHLVRRRRRHRQDDARDARLARPRSTPGRTRRDLLAAAPARTSCATTMRPRTGTLELLDRLGDASTCCTSTTSAPRAATDWVLEQLYSIVNTRYEEERSLVITTNLDPDAARRADRRAHRVAHHRDVRRPAAAVRRPTARREYRPAG